MPSKRLVALAALAMLALASLAPSASADWCADQRARCLKRCGGKEADMDFDCRDKSGARSVSCSCSNGMAGFSGGDGGGGSSSFSGSGAGAFAGTGLGGGGSGGVFGGGLSTDQVARDGFSNVARVARGENPLFFGGDGEGGGAGGSGTKQQQPGSSDATTSGSDRGPLPATISSSSQPTTPSWAVALAVIASLVAATCAGALGFVVMRRRHEKKAAAIATPALPLYDYDASKPSAESPTKTGHAL